MAEEHVKIDDIIASVMREKLKRYLAGKISSEIVRQHHKLPKAGTKLKEDEAPTNAMGHSSSVSGTGPIDTFDPLLRMQIARRKAVANWLPVARKKSV
jgi:hypothetical protein